MISKPANVELLSFELLCKQLFRRDSFVSHFDQILTKQVVFHV